MSAWSDEYMTLIADCEARESRLTDWERSFISSLRSQLEAERHPTAKQIDTLDEVWEKATAKG